MISEGSTRFSKDFLNIYQIDLWSCCLSIISLLRCKNNTVCYLLTVKSIKFIKRLLWRFIHSGMDNDNRFKLFLTVKLLWEAFDHFCDLYKNNCINHSEHGKL